MPSARRTTADRSHAREPEARAASAAKAAPKAPAPLVLITGSSGFLGSGLIERLHADHRLIGLDLHAPAEASAHAEFIGIDLTSGQSVAAALQRVHAVHGIRIACVIHLAGYFDLSGEPDPRYDAVTLHGSERLIQALKDFQVEQFVFMSTMLVHQACGHDATIDEESPLDDRFPYRASKIRTEAMLREQHGDIPVVMLRPAGIYDDAGHATFLSHQIARIFERRITAHAYPGDQQAGQPFLHIDDLADALRRLIARRSKLPRETALLLAEDEVLGYGEIQALVGRTLHGEHWATYTIPDVLASGGAWVQDKLFEQDPFIKPWMVQIASDHYRVDTSRARQLLGWRPEHNMRESLPKILAALQADPVGWYRANGLNPARVTAAAHDESREDAHVKAAGHGETSSQDDAPDGQHHEQHPDMTKEMREGHFKMLWVHWFNILLGAWLVSSPFAFGSFDTTQFSDAVLGVTSERGLADPALRSLWLGRSDVISGLAIMLFGALSLSPRWSWAQWANAAVGTWLLFAPLVFWAPSAAAYTNDTLVGALVIAFAVLVPMMPGMAMAGMMDKSDLPPGWSYSPSSYLQRLPIIALGLFGFLLARSLTAYQLGHTEGVWEPFFAGVAPDTPLNGTEAIITSSVSKAWPIADAGLGGVAYVFEVLMGVMGDRRRWRTMPWMVAMFGIVVVPLGVISIYFIVIQPVVIGTWCTLCLATAVAMLVMIPFSLDELVAMGQFLVQSHSRGEPFWRTFFKGGAQPAQGRDDHTSFDVPLPAAVRAAARGVTVPWTLAACVAIGVALMFTRLWFGSVPPMANSDHVVGAMIVTFAVIAMAEVARTLRFVNIAFGLWLLAVPWLLDGANGTAAWASVLAGALVIVLSLPRGRLSGEHYGRWDRLVL